MEDSYLDSFWEDRNEMAYGRPDFFDQSEPRHAPQPQLEEEEEEEPPFWSGGRCEDSPCCGCCGGE